MGFFLFARRYLGNNYCSLLLLVLRCFTSQGMLLEHKAQGCRGLLYRVSPFGNLRIKDCFASPRSLSQQRHVLHRLLKSRHPPYALKFPVKKFENHKLTKLKKKLYPDRSGLKLIPSFLLIWAKRPFSKPDKFFNFQRNISIIYPAFGGILDFDKSKSGQKNRLSGGLQTKKKSAISAAFLNCFL